MSIRSVTVEHNGNTKSKLTVTAENDVRIKVGLDVHPDEEMALIERLTKFAKQIIADGLNDVTLRGSTKSSLPESIDFQNSSRKLQLHIKLEL